MSFSQMAQILREQNKEKIVLIKVGVFFIAIEEDAVLLNNKLKLTSKNKKRSTRSFRKNKNISKRKTRIRTKQ